MREHAELRMWKYRTRYGDGLKGEVLLVKTGVVMVVRKRRA